MYYKTLFRCGLALALCSAGTANAARTDAAQATTRSIPEIVVVESAGRRDQTDITPGASAAPVPDAIAVLQRMPGADVNRNGPLSGQAQYRGLFGPRVDVTVNHMHVTPGGLNWMDAPLHYLPASLTARVTMKRGIAPVSAGPGIGGSIDAESKSSHFTDSGQFQLWGDAAASGMTNTGGSTSAFVALANNRERFHLLASNDQGGDYRSPDGEVGATGYRRATGMLGYGYRFGESSLGLNVSYTDTGNSGTPSLPLDIRFFHTWRGNGVFETSIDNIDLSLRVFTTVIHHSMDNYTLRPAPDVSQLPLPPFQGDDKRFVNVGAHATGFVARAVAPLAGGDLMLGVDGNTSLHGATIYDPDFAPFFVRNFNDARSRRVGLYAQWDGALGDGASLEVGTRYTRVNTDTGAVDAQPAQLADANPGTFGPGTPPFAVKMLRDRFNALDRSRTDGNVDFVVTLERRLNDDLRVGAGYARKTRSPLYLERYLWIPLEVNSGLGDLNNYVGNPDLEPEVSDQVELNLDWRGNRLRIAPRLFYRRIRNYIQGVPATDPMVIAVSANANGDATPLQFANVGARLYGFDLVARYTFTAQTRLDATVNYVRGERTDISDNLFRIAPLNARISLTRDWGAWSVTAESVLVARQRNISRTIVLEEPHSSNAEVPGYGLVNLYALWQPGDVSIRLGVENALNRRHVDSLSGFNRVINSSVSVGDRVPGPGINAFAQVQVNW